MPGIFFSNRFKLIIFITTIIATGITLTIGYYNANEIVVKHQDINIPKQAGNPQKLNAVMVSDIHLGALIDNNHLQKIVKKINALEPDIILMPGDLVDSDLEPVLKKNSGEAFKALHPKLGIYATTGNHEYIGGVQEATEYLEQYNIRFLRDTTLFINESFYLIGREDREINRFEDKERKSLNQLTALIDTTYPVILMDHQPFHPEKTADAGIDLQLSGHTHNGQLWPINYITSALFDISNGYGKINDMHIYVSSGAGTWGPPIRIGSQAEIVNLNIHFSQANK
ncbi:MAG: metallophosphoesterase [Bacteroidales bacterium]